MWFVCSPVWGSTKPLKTVPNKKLLDTLIGTDPCERRKNVSSPHGLETYTQNNHQCWFSGVSWNVGGKKVSMWRFSDRPQPKSSICPCSYLWYRIPHKYRSTLDLHKEWTLPWNISWKPVDPVQGTLDRPLSTFRPLPSHQ